MMPFDRMPSISLRIIVPADATYDSRHNWRNDLGVAQASVRFEAGGHSTVHIQGEPAGLRELAVALAKAAGSVEPAAGPTPARAEETAD